MLSKDLSQKGQLLYQMYRVNKSMNTTFDTWVSIGQSRLELLALIHQENEVTQADLQKLVTLNKAAITRHLIQLEEQKLVSRRKKDDDHRVVWVKLTELGIELYKASQKEKYQFANEILEGISDEELDTLQNILEQLERNTARIAKDN